MADLAFGISKAAVQLLAEKVRTAIKEEAEQWQTVQRDVVFISGEFEMMQSFLRSADEDRVQKNHVVRTWVRQVRDLSFDVEDCIEFVLHLDTKSSSCWLRLLRSCSCRMDGAPASDLDQAVVEIKQLKARVEDVSKRNIRYTLVGDTESKPLIMQQQWMSGPSSIGAHILVEARDMAQKYRGVINLTNLITDKNEDLQVISLWGPRDDLQTMSVIRDMYHHPSISEKFRCRAWVKVMHPFNPHQFIRSLVAQFYTNSCQEKGTSLVTYALSMNGKSTGDLAKDFVRQVNTNGYLVILEDISTMVQWDAISSYLPDMNKGSRIVVSTRHHEIASLCTRKPYRVMELQRFIPTNQSICVFFGEALFQPGKGGRNLAGFVAPTMEQVRSTQRKTKGQQVRHGLSSKHLVGREWEQEKLFDLITRRVYTNKPHVVAVWGIPGSGRTAVVGNVYGCCQDMKKFDRRTHVTMPQPFNLMGFCQCLLRGWGETLTADPIGQCRAVLHESHHLAVIEDMLSKEDWELIKAANLICGQCKSCIIVVTTEESTALCCAGAEDQVCGIKCLQATAAYNLFKQELGDNGNRIYRNHPSVEAILSRSGGLPEVIIAIGGYLARQQHEDRFQWECQLLSSNFMQQLQNNPSFLCLQGLLNQMHFHIRSCPPSLRRCMAYLLIFPQGEAFRRRRVVRRWIAEGYTKCTESKSLEDSAGELFHKLTSKSVMQEAIQTTMKDWYKVNGFFHECIISHLTEEKDFLTLEVSALGDEGRCVLTTEGTGQHLAIWSGWTRNKVVFDNLDFSRLRSLTVFGEWQSFFVSDKMRVLRVLDLEATKNVKYDDLETMVELLPRLKFLSLRGCKEITRLPDNIGDLRQLQTLDIRHTSIVKLPTSITKLLKLQYFRAGTTTSSDPPNDRRHTYVNSFLSWFCGHGSQNGGVEVPRGIGKLTALHTLGVVNVSGSSVGMAILEDLSSLTRLCKLGVSGINRENMKHLSLASHLESLSLYIQKSSHAVRPDDIVLPRKLQSLKLYGLGETIMPPSIQYLSNLMKLSLEMITIKQEDIQVLGKLQSLRALRLLLKEAENDGKLQFFDSCNEDDLHDDDDDDDDDDGDEDEDDDDDNDDVDDEGDDLSPSCDSYLFPKLQVLDICCTDCLLAKFGRRAMQLLEHLVVRHCGSRLQLSGLKHLPSLKQVSLRGSYDEVLKEALQKQLAKCRSRPTLH